MGVHFGTIATKAPFDELRAAIAETWDDLEVVSSAGGFGNIGEVFSWIDANQRLGSAKGNPPSAVYVLCQDGPWSVVVDYSYLLAGDEPALEKLSARLGCVVSFVVETAGGCAYFWQYEFGELRRMIENVDGKVNFYGMPIQEEEGIDVSKYYMDETEQLMRALGLSNPNDLPIVSNAIAVSAIDRTDYSKEGSSIAGGQNPEKLSSIDEKPWWKFW